MNTTPWMPSLRGARRNTLAALLLGVLAAPSAHALTAAQWQAVAPAVQAAIECRDKPNTATAAWKALPDGGAGGIGPFTPPTALTVFGLPVRQVTIFIDTSGELGESYSADVAASAAMVRKAAKLNAAGERTTRMGELALTADDTVKITCGIDGTYDESDYQEPAGI